MNFGNIIVEEKDREIKLYNGSNIKGIEYDKLHNSMYIYFIDGRNDYIELDETMCNVMGKILINISNGELVNVTAAKKSEWS